MMHKFFPLAVLAIMCLSWSAISFAQAQEENSRQIVLEEFTRARPTVTAIPSSPGNVKRGQRGRASASMSHPQRPTYHRVGSALSSIVASSKRPAGASRQALGVTLWRLRPSRSEDEEGARMLVMEDVKQKYWTPERIELDTSLKVGERVRISVESPRAGYLYVVDREQYADGSLGDAFLIFPTTRTRNGDNKVRPGKLIDIPAQEDAPNYFTLVPSPSRSDQVGEMLSFIVTTQPLEDLPISEKPLKVSKSDIAKWEKNWTAAVERFELNGGAGRVWTKEEKAAGAMTSSRLLTQEEPSPQTIYRIVAKATGSLLVTIPLRYGGSRP